MRNYSLDLESENINSPLTKDYFQEVIRSYYNENYRSAIVMLYSVTICDLVYKLKTLKDLYDDSSAISILDRIEQQQLDNPRSPEWENKLIELVKNETNLLEPIDQLNIDTLQKHRHLCAHPVMTQDYELYRPNKETVRAHIRNLLEGLFTKPPILSRKIFSDLLLDLSENSALFISDEKLERYLNEKYLKNLRKIVEKQLFRSLWKIIFRVNNDEANKNRDINFRALKIFLKRNYDLMFEEISSDKQYYSNIDRVAIQELIALFVSYPSIYKLMTDSAKLIIETAINTDINLGIRSWFTEDNMDSHLNKILKENYYLGFPSGKQHPYVQSILDLSNTITEQIDEERSHETLIKYFLESASYDIADIRYDQLIKPYLDKLSKHHLHVLIEGINRNSQIYDRRLAKTSNAVVKIAVDKKDKSFDYSKYKNFMRSINS